VLLSAQAAPDSYRILIQRTDETAGCATWPQSGFGGSYGATVTITQPADVQCLVIPSGQHSTGEMIDYSNAANVVDGEIDVRDPAGNEICRGASTAICAYQPGVTYTALVFSSIAGGDTYHLVRRDVSQTANCATPASTTVGGPSTTFTLTSDLDTVCYRVTAATADKLWFAVRTLAPTPVPPPATEPSPSSAVLQVTGPTGAIMCRQWGTSGCRVTGSADYQLIVTAEGYAGVAITTHLDAWRVATASGWASQCTGNSIDASGDWGPVRPTLTEQATGYCALVTGLQQDQSFGIFGTDSTPWPQVPFVNIYTNWDWTQTFVNGVCGQNNVGQFGFSCATNEEQNPSQGILLVGPGAAQSPTAVTMWGVCSFPCTVSRQPSNLTSVSPASQPAGLNTIVITGTSLTMATTFELLGSSGPAAYGTPVSVNAAGTQLTLLLNTSGVALGTYTAWLGQSSCSPQPTSCPGYLPNAYTVTAGPPAPSPEQYTPVNPARILDTRSGLGAPKAKVAAHGTLTLTVAGKGGVPANNVAAVAVDVTAISPSATGYLTAYPAGATRPGVADLNFSSGQTVTNLVVVRLGGGKISLHNAGGGTLDLTADVVGYYAVGARSTFTATSPGRILDTRSGLGAPKAKVGAHGTVTLTVAGKGGVPSSGATAVAVNVAAISPTATGSLTIYPNGTSRPTTSALSFTSGQTTVALAVVRLVNGKVSLYNGTSGTLDLTADVVGYYASGGATFLPVGPTRVLDTRSGLGGSGQTVLSHAAAVTRVMNVPELASANVTAVLVEVTVLNAQHSGTLTAFPDQAAVPGQSTFPFPAGQAVTRLVVVPVVNGNIDFYNRSSGTIQVVADLLGFYAD
jgi:hypothetical protein